MRLFIALASSMPALALLAMPAQAATISYVTTVTSIFSGAASSNYDSVQGLRTNAGSCYQQGTVILGPCATVTSTPGTNVLGATAATTATLNGVEYDPHTGISGYGSAYASANLGTGILGVYTLGPDCSIPNFGGCDSGGYTVAEMQDALTFNNTTGAAVNIGVTWRFDGTAGATGMYASESLDNLFCLGVGQACAGLPNSLFHPPINAGQSFTFSYTSNSTGTSQNHALPTTSSWVSTSYTPGANGMSGTFNGFYTIPKGVSTDTLNAYFEAYCLLSNCDFSHTAALSISNLPAGVSFTSSSGVLLTVSPVPEPATWLLLCMAAAATLMLRGKWRV